MKKIIILMMSIVMMSGCSTLAFDGLQFDRYVTIYETTDGLQTLCDKPEKRQILKAKIDELDLYVGHMKTYADFRGNNQEVQTVTSSIASMISELKQRYADGNVPSAAYCQEKLIFIRDGAKTITGTLGAQ